MTELMTDPQRKYLVEVLLKDKKMLSVNRAKWTAEALAPGFTKKQASEQITKLKSLPWLSKAEKATLSTVVADVQQAEQVFKGEQGFYRGGSGKVYSYLMTNKGYKMWRMLTEKSAYNWDKATGKYVVTKKGSYVKVYSGSAKKDIETGGKKLTMEEVVAHGSLMGYCLCCGRTLTDPTSVANKIGPVCAEKYSGMLVFA